MAAENQPLFMAKNLPAPQYYNPRTSKYEVLLGRDGANSFIEKGRVVKDAFHDTESVTRNYQSKMFGFGIVNDGDTDITFTINDFTILVKPYESFDDLFDGFTTVIINSTGAFRAVVRE